MKLTTTATTSTTTPSPFADELEALTARALDACNRAIEVEMSPGMNSNRKRVAWAYYRKCLDRLGRATYTALYELGQENPVNVRKAG